jgi:hypothetical protein
MNGRSGYSSEVIAFLLSIDQELGFKGGMGVAIWVDMVNTEVDKVVEGLGGRGQSKEESHYKYLGEQQLVHLARYIY